MITRFSPKQIQVLQALARYKFLTYSQMATLGIERHRSNLSTLLKGLRESSFPMVRKIPHGMGDEVKHYLTEKAVPVLCELCGLEASQIHCPKGTILTDTQDQAHRTRLIDFHIALDLACQQTGIGLLFCDRYFDTIGNNRVEKNLKSKTAFEYKSNSSIKPDMVFKLQTASQEELFIVELENGRDAKKTVEKCIRHAEAVLSGSVNQRFNFNRGYRVLWILEFDGTLQTVLERLQGNPLFLNITEYFLFKPFSQMSNEVFLKWRNVAGKERKMFY
jgi:hypothetical protein